MVDEEQIKEKERENKELIDYVADKLQYSEKSSLEITIDKYLARLKKDVQLQHLIFMLLEKARSVRQVSGEGFLLADFERKFVAGDKITRDLIRSHVRKLSRLCMIELSSFKKRKTKVKLAIISDEQGVPVFANPFFTEFYDVLRTRVKESWVSEHEHNTQSVERSEEKRP